MKPATKESVKIRQLTDYPAFAAAKAKLDQLNEALAATNLRIDKLKIQSNRVSSEARHYLTHGIRVLALEDSAIERKASLKLSRPAAFHASSWPRCGTVPCSRRLPIRI